MHKLTFKVLISRSSASSIFMPLHLSLYQAFKAEIHPHVSEIQQLNQELAAMKNMSPVAAETLQRPVEAVNAKWSDMVQAISDREVIICLYSPFSRVTSRYWCFVLLNKGLSFQREITLSQVFFFLNLFLGEVVSSINDYLHMILWVWSHIKKQIKM